MHISLTGLNHTTTPVEVREEVSFSKQQLPEAHLALKAAVGESVLLSTCNRTEVYSVTEEPARVAADVRRFLADFHNLDQDLLSPHLYDLTDADATRHLFRVASGLDSMILGESEILGQIRDALQAASESQALSAPVSRLFHRAIRTGRRVREETDVGRKALSVSYAAVQLTRRVLGELGGLRVLLIGAGEAGELVARALRSSGVSDLVISNRTPERAEALARKLAGRTLPFEEVRSGLAEADIVITATEASAHVLTSAAIDEAVRARNGRPSFLFDLSVPRNIDPQAGMIDGVNLFNIDDLSTIAEENLEDRRHAAADAEAVVEEEVTGFMAWWESLEALPLIKALREQAEGIREHELERALRMMPDLSAGEREVLDAMSRSLINRLLHEPTVALKQRSSPAMLSAVRDLFRLWGKP